ncbi:MAG TPA: (d)CMP kinase [Gammaproteobacteria bacterium]|nr:(d)CMP kinase [Gammaproteobacteria bacterium]|tara:strand:+ start:1453 stop:2127 length:675 start_codon:yes stop_codon:yes gene_type:complete
MNQASSLIPVVTIDGPSGVGKGTLAARLAETLGWHLLDSGALYRILGSVAESRQIAPDNVVELVALTATIDIEFRGAEVRVDGADLSLTIRTEEAGVAASKVAALGPVREALLAAQQRFRRTPGLVADGRDMGTVVFPDSRAKLFLDATPAARAERRYIQLKNKGLSVSLRGLLAQIEERDQRDRERAVAPLKPAADAVVIDTTEQSIDAVYEQALALVQAAYS